MKSIKKILPIAMMFVVLATSSISAHAACYVSGEHYRPPGVRCYGACLHSGHEDNGVFYVRHTCSSCSQTRRS